MQRNRSTALGFLMARYRNPISGFALIAVAFLIVKVCGA